MNKKTNKLYDLLGSDYFWVDAKGNKYILSEMTTSHLRNALNLALNSECTFRTSNIFNIINKLRRELYRRHCLGEDITA